MGRASQGDRYLRQCPLPSLPESNLLPPSQRFVCKGVCEGGLYDTNHCGSVVLNKEINLYDSTYPARQMYQGSFDTPSCNRFHPECCSPHDHLSQQPFQNSLQNSKDDTVVISCCNNNLFQPSLPPFSDKLDNSQLVFVDPNFQQHSDFKTLLSADLPDLAVNSNNSYNTNNNFNNNSFNTSDQQNFENFNNDNINNSNNNTDNSDNNNYDKVVQHPLVAPTTILRNIYAEQLRNDTNLNNNNNTNNNNNNNNRSKDNKNSKSVNPDQNLNIDLASNKCLNEKDNKMNNKNNKNNNFNNNIDNNNVSKIRFELNEILSNNNKRQPQHSQQQSQRPTQHHNVSS